MIEYEMSIVLQSFNTSLIEMDWLQNWLMLKFKRCNQLGYEHFMSTQHLGAAKCESCCFCHSQFHFQTQQIQINIEWIDPFLAAQSFQLNVHCELPETYAEIFLVFMSALSHLKH